jgi:hypothetical protein
MNSKIVDVTNAICETKRGVEEEIENQKYTVESTVDDMFKIIDDFRTTSELPCGVHLHRMGLRRSNECTLCQRAWRQREDDEHDGCGRSNPETLGHIQSVRCALQARATTSVRHHCWMAASSVGNSGSAPESKGWTFLTLEG